MESSKYRDIDDEELRKIVEDSKEYFKNVDPSFFGGLAKLYKAIVERMQNVNIDPSKMEDVGEMPPTISPFQVFQEYFESLDPTLASIAVNQLMKANFYTPLETVMEKVNNNPSGKQKLRLLLQFMQENFKIPQSFDIDKVRLDIMINKRSYAVHSHLPVEKNWYIVLLYIHEATHRMVTNDDMSVIPENKPIYDEDYGFLQYPLYVFTPHSVSGLTRYLVDETASIYDEVMGNDFIKDKYHAQTSSLMATRFKQLKDFTDSDKDTEIPLFELLEEYLYLIKTEELTTSNKEKYKSIISKMIQISDKALNRNGNNNKTGKPISYSEASYVIHLQKQGLFTNHNIGFILANYLHQKNRNNKTTGVKTLKSLISANSIIEEYGDFLEDGIDSDPNIVKRSRIGQEEISHMEAAGLPIAKDGRLKMDDEDVQALLDALDKLMEEEKDLFTNEPITIKHDKDELTLSDL